MSKLKAFLQKMKKYCNYYTYFVLGFVVINFLLTLHLCSRQGMKNIGAICAILIVEVIIEIVLALLFIRLKRKNIPIEKLFLLFYIPIGLLFIIFLPSQQAPDSYAHLTRAYEISNGVLLAQPAENGTAGAILPVEIRHFIEQENNYSYELQDLGLNFSGETYVEQKHYPSAAGYAPLSYLPHVIGIWIGRILHLPVIVTIILGRITCMLVCAAIFYFAIKLAPRYKTFMAFIALLPMTLQQTTSYTADALTIAVSFFVVGLALHFIFGNVEKIKGKHIAAMISVGVVLALCKVVYFPLVGLFMLIPWKKFGTRRKKWLIAIGIVALAILAEFMWMKIQTTSQGTIVANGQLDYVIGHPLGYLFKVFQTMADYMSSFYVGSTFGMSLGAWRFTIPDIYLYLAIIALIITFIQATEHYNVTRGKRLMAWTIFAVVIIAFMTAMFTQWTKDLKYIDGVQGRYFIPLLPLIPIMISSSKKKKEEKTRLDCKYPLVFNMFFCMIAVVTIVIVNLT